MTKFVAYYRVSTERQGKSGLGLAAQKRKIDEFLTSNGDLVGEFCDIQSGRDDNRTELQRALALAKREIEKQWLPLGTLAITTWPRESETP